jgi:DNA gyrase subunit B
LLASYRDIKDIQPPMAVATVASAAPAAEEAEAERPPADEVPQAGATVEGLGDRSRGKAEAKDSEVRITSLDELIEFFINAGKKGVAINRYKGLGEMNPEQLWATTMNPEIRTLLQVRAEDHTEADQMFTTLMGDQVEPRRKFIEDNALDVKNLDV